MRKRNSRLIVWLLVISFLASQSFFADSGHARAGESNRLSGNDKYKTAVEISKQGWETSDYAVLARGDDFADALCAGPVARKYDAPILLTEPLALNDDTLNELMRLAVKHVLIAGGTGAVSHNVESALKSAGIADVERIYGSDRYETSVRMAERLGNISKIVMVAGDNFPDALSISAAASKLGMPILLTDKNSLPDKVKQYIASKQISQTYIAGGNDVVSDRIKNLVPNPKRLGGSDRYETNALVLQEFESEFNYETIYVSTGEGFADALTGTAIASRTSSPMLLTNGTLPVTIGGFVKSKIKLETKVVSIGGSSVVPSSIIDSITAYKEYAPASAKYDKAGIYGPKENSHTVRGSVIISSRDVTLQNTTIEGDLLLGQSIGDGNVTLKNVTVKGKTYINGGGPNSVIMYNFNGQTVAVDVPNGGRVRLVAQGNTTIGSVLMESDGMLEEDGVTGSGFTTIEIPEDAEVTLMGEFNTVNVGAGNASVNVQSGTINILNIAETARGANVNLSNGTRIDYLTLNSPSSITGQGQINNAAVNASGTTIEQRPASTVIKDGVTTRVAGEQKMGTAQSSNSSSGGGSGDDGGYTPPDTTSPEFAATYPKSANLLDKEFDLLMQVNESGGGYYVVLPAVAEAPSAVQVAAGQDNTGTTAAVKGSIDLIANTEGIKNVSGLNPETAYKAYIVVKDAAGNISEVKIVSILTLKEFSSISLASAMTQDLDEDGKIDAVKLTFSGDIKDSTVAAGEFTIEGYGGISFGGTANGDTANNSVMYLVFAEGSTYDSGAMPEITYTAGNIEDMTGKLLKSFNRTPDDGAKPVIDNLEVIYE